MNNDDYKNACIEYVYLTEEAYKNKTYLPSATWLYLCSLYNLNPSINYAPKPGYIVCPLCKISRPYAMIPLAEKALCTEWHMHESKEDYFFDLRKNWQSNPDYKMPKDFVHRTTFEEVLKKLITANKKK